MSESDGASLRVNFCHIESDLPDAVERLASKGFIDFVDVNVILAQSSGFQQLGDSQGWSDAHDVGGAA